MTQEAASEEAKQANGWQRIRKNSYSEQFCGKTSEWSTRAESWRVSGTVVTSVPTPSQESLSGRQSLSKYLHQHRLNRKQLPSQERSAFVEVSILQPLGCHFHLSGWTLRCMCETRTAKKKKALPHAEQMKWWPREELWAWKLEVWTKQELSCLYQDVHWTDLARRLVWSDYSVWAHLGSSHWFVLTTWCFLFHSVFEKKNQNKQKTLRFQYSECNM